MFAVKFLTILLISQVLSESCDNSKCPPVPKHYEELNCKPIIPSGQCCPTKFDCENREIKPLEDDSRCYYKGTWYNRGDRIKTETCTLFCACHGAENDPAYIDCTHVDCPGQGSHEDKNCIYQFDEQSCCYSKQVCGDDMKKLSTCTFNGETYYEGQEMESGNPKYSCICDKNFEDKPAEINKSCKKVYCGIDLLHGDKIRNGNVPIYYEKEESCPIDFIYPGLGYSYEIEKFSTPTDDLFCEFDDNIFSIGDYFTLTDSYYDSVCTCKTPPLMTCILSDSPIKKLK